MSDSLKDMLNIYSPPKYNLKVGIHLHKSSSAKRDRQCKSDKVMGSLNMLRMVLCILCRLYCKDKSKADINCSNQIDRKIYLMNMKCNSKL